MIIISSFDKIININLNKDKVFIGDIKLNNINEFKIIDFQEISSMEEGSYFLKYRMKFNFFGNRIFYYRKLLLFVEK